MTEGQFRLFLKERILRCSMTLSLMTMQMLTPTSALQRSVLPRRSVPIRRSVLIRLWLCLYMPPCLNSEEPPEAWSVVAHPSLPTTKKPKKPKRKEQSVLPPVPAEIREECLDFVRPLSSSLPIVNKLCLHPLFRVRSLS
eukprot:3430218-Amphidinium_carterae.4